jgi:hypothetical protein
VVVSSSVAGAVRWQNPWLAAHTGRIRKQSPSSPRQGASTASAVHVTECTAQQGPSAKSAGKCTRKGLQQQRAAINCASLERAGITVGSDSLADTLESHTPYWGHCQAPTPPLTS